MNENFLEFSLLVSGCSGPRSQLLFHCVTILCFHWAPMAAFHGYHASANHLFPRHLLHTARHPSATTFVGTSTSTPTINHARSFQPPNHHGPPWRSCVPPHPEPIHHDHQDFGDECQARCRSWPPIRFHTHFIPSKSPPPVETIIMEPQNIDTNLSRLSFNFTAIALYETWRRLVSAWFFMASWTLCRRVVREFHRSCLEVRRLSTASTVDGP